jgi:hypothetical protein
MINVTTPCSPPLGYLSHPSVSDYGFLTYKGDRDRILTPGLRIGFKEKKGCGKGGPVPLL